MLSCVFPRNASDNDRLRSIDLSAEVQETRTEVVDRGLPRKGEAPHPHPDPPFEMPGPVRIARGPQFDSKSPPDTLYIAADYTIFQFTASTKQLTPIQFTIAPPLPTHNPKAKKTGTPFQRIRSCGLACLASGILIAPCQFSHLIFAIDVQKHTAIRIAGAYPRTAVSTEVDQPAFDANFCTPAGIVLNESETECWICDLGTSTLKKLIFPDYFDF